MKRVAVVGAGPAGLCAALMLVEHGVEVVVLERDSSPGGLRSPDPWAGFRFHYGIHPFSTRNSLLEGLLKGLLGEDLLHQTPVRALWTRGSFMDNKTSSIQLAKQLGAETFGLGMAGYFLSRRLQGRSPSSLSEWSGLTVGPWIHDAIVEPLVTKAWGLGGTGLEAPEHAVMWPRPPSVQASLSTVLGKILPNRWGVQVGQPCYVPRKGWGHLAEIMRQRLEKKGGQVRCEAPVRGLRLHNARFSALLPATGPALEADAVVLSNPLPEWAEWLTPDESASPASGLHHRHLLLLGLTLKSPVPLMRYHTVDLADPAIPAVTVHSPSAWDPNSGPTHQLLLETYLAAHDPLWHAPDQEVLRQMNEGAAKLGLWNPDEVESFHLVRLPNAAPVHGHGYSNLRAGAMTLADAVPNISVCGRGLFLHQGVDASMESGFRAALQTLSALGLRPASF